MTPVRRHWFVRAVDSAGSRLLIPVLAAVLVTGIVVAESHSRGRLSSHPTVDNVNYMGSAANWIKYAREGGTGELLRQYARQPPHAPYSVTVSFAAFFIGGVDLTCPHFLYQLL